MIRLKDGVASEYDKNSWTVLRWCARACTDVFLKSMSLTLWPFSKLVLEYYTTFITFIASQAMALMITPEWVPLL